MTTAPIRVAIVEDHPMFRDGLRAALASDEAIEVVGTASDAEQGLELVAQQRPDVVVMDLRLPGMSGIEATRRIVTIDEHARVLVLSMLDDDDSVFSAMRAGARGYLLKGADRDEAVGAIRAVVRGDLVFGAGVAQRIMGFFAGRERSHAEAAFPELTPREREVLDRLARGDDNTAIAQRFGLSVKTVQNHVSSILDKLQVIDRGGAIARARDAGLGAP
ncbi:MAG: response regulator transcription factor [Chloroflexota bacterium]